MCLVNNSSSCQGQLTSPLGFFLSFLHLSQDPNLKMEIIEIKLMLEVNNMQAQINTVFYIMNVQNVVYFGIWWLLWNLSAKVGPFLYVVMNICMFIIVGQQLKMAAKLTPSEIMWPRNKKISSIDNNRSFLVFPFTGAGSNRFDHVSWPR